MTLAFWIFNLFVAGMLVVDFTVLHKENRAVTFKQALGWSLFWVFLALAFNLGIFYYRGLDDALNFFAGYLIEKSLSVDNLFVFLMIFSYFSVPKAYQYKVLFWGVFAAIVLRALFILIGVELVQKFHWLLYIFGIFLIYTGYKLLTNKAAEIHPDDNFILKLFRRMMPVTKNYVGGKFFVFENGRWLATPLFIVLLSVETTDVIFAIDSIPAIMGITLDPFIVYTSNIFAILGLRALYFLLSGLMDRFHYLNVGLGIILVGIGIKMLLEGYLHIPIYYTLSFIISVLGASMYFSTKYPKSVEK